MSMKDEVEQIILRSILKDGLDAVPQDYEFIMKYNLKQIYFSKIEFSMHGIGIDIKSSALEKLKKAIIEDASFPLLHDEYKKNGKAGVMQKLHNNETYYKTFLKCIRNGK